LERVSAPAKGAADAGAHLRNMAFYNFGLALLQLALQDSPAMTPEKAVWRLTGEIAQWYDLDTGVLKPGAQADIVLLDPMALKHAKLDRYAEAPFEAMGGLQRVVNRNDGVIKCTLIAGQVAFENDAPSPLLGKHAMGRFLAR
jgi:N-acyl-D-aspartate/D-glutamate deacylase